MYRIERDNSLFLRKVRETCRKAFECALLSHVLCPALPSSTATVCVSSSFCPFLLFVSIVILSCASPRFLFRSLSAWLTFLPTTLFFSLRLCLCLHKFDSPLRSLINFVAQLGNSGCACKSTYGLLSSSGVSLSRSAPRASIALSAAVSPVGSRENRRN